MKAINKLLKRKKKPKILSTGPTLNQSMIDIIVNDRPANESFHSQQGGLMRSPSIGGNEVDIDDLASTDRIDTMFDSPNRIPMKANIGSVLNMPKRRNIIEDLYEILHEQVIEQIGDLISAKKNSIKETDIPKVQLSDFQEYIQRLKSVHQIYKKQNYRRMDKRRKNEKVDIPASLAHCYRVVPELYFAANFEFNFEYLTSDKAKVMKVQEDIGGFLDLVEFNLHLQLTNRFQEFVDVILKLSQMEAQIQNSLFVTSFFRDLNKDLRLKCSQQVAKVLSNKRKKFNMQKTLELAKVINSVRQIIPTLVQLVEKNNLEEAMTLIKTSEETYRTQLIRLKAVKHLIMDFKDARNILEKLVTGKFEEKYLAYVTPALRYTKKAQTPYMSDMSIVEESFINVSTMEGSQTFDDEPSSHLSLNWTLDPFKPNEQIETYLVSTVLEYIKIKAFSLNQCREKLNTLLTRFHKQFVADMDEYIASIGINKAIPGHESATFDLHIKFIMFYFQIWKRFIQTNLSLVSNIFTKIMNYSNKNFAKSNDQGINQESLQNIGGTIEETYSTLAIIFKQFNEKISEVISKQSVDNISSHQFSKLTSLFNEITNFFDREIRLHDRLTGWIVSDSEKIKQPLLNLAESFAGRINITPVINLKTQCGKEFIAYFHKHNFDSLKHNLENDAWVVSDIPYTYKTYFDILFGVKQTVGKSPAKEKNELDEDIFKSARPDVNDLEIIKKLALGDTFTQRDNNQTMEITQQDIEFDEKEVVEIKKNELVVHDKRFKVNSSLLVLIKMSCDYFNIACRFNQISELTISRLFDLIKFYNSFSRRLVYGAEATMLGKVKKITAKILVLSLVSLDLLDILITSFHQTIENSVKDIRQDWLNAEITTIRQEIRTHINDIKNKIRMILKSKLNELSLDLKNIGWGDPQGKVNIPTKSSAGILHNTRQMYKNIEDILIKEHLIDVFNSIFKDLKDYFIPVFESLPIENKIAAKRVKEELDYFTEDLYHIPVFQEPELNFGEFRNKIKEILEKKCNHLLEPEQKQNGEAEPEAEAEEKPVEEPQSKEEEQQERLEENGEKEDQPEEKPEENEEKEEKEENEEKIEIEIEKTEKEENIEAEDNAAVEDGAENGAGDV